MKSLSKQAMCRGFVVDWGVEYTHTHSRLKYVTAAYVRQQQFPPVEGVSINFFLDPVPLSNSALSCKLYKSAVKTYAIKQGEWAAGTSLHDLSFAWLLCSQLVEPLYSGPSALKGKSAIVLKGKSKNQCINKRHSLRISNNLLGESIKDQGITPKVTEIFVHSMTFKKQSYRNRAHILHFVLPRIYSPSTILTTPFYLYVFLLSALETGTKALFSIISRGEHGRC